MLSYTGGGALTALRRAARRASRSAALRQRRPRAYQPAIDAPRRAVLSYLGTYAADRQAALDSLFLEPARRRPEVNFLIGGAQYPRDFPWRDNIFFARHVPPHDHPRFTLRRRRP